MDSFKYFFFFLDLILGVAHELMNIYAGDKKLMDSKIIKHGHLTISLKSYAQIKIALTYFV
jgi:hypothetical protein